MEIGAPYAAMGTGNMSVSINSGVNGNTLTSQLSNYVDLQGRSLNSTRTKLKALQ